MNNYAFVFLQYFTAITIKASLSDIVTHQFFFPEGVSQQED